MLLRLSEGDRSPIDHLMQAVYDELRKIAAAQMRREKPGHTLQPTALAHEAYLRLVDQSQVDWKNRAHFLGMAAEMIRRILIDHARARATARRGGSVERVSLSDVEDRAADGTLDVLALDEALGELRRRDERQARVVELRYFGGASVEETAHVLGVSERTVAADWTVARAWLRRRLQK